MAVSFVLSNAFSDKHISNKTTVTPFSKTVFPIFKSFAPEDKPANNFVILA